MPTLEWIGKDKVINHHLDVPYRVLERKYSYDEAGQHDEDNGSENMIIHGDNLDALKSLLSDQPSHVPFSFYSPRTGEPSDSPVPFSICPKNDARRAGAGNAPFLPDAPGTFALHNNSE